jgi:hypothetical protein
VTKNNQVGLLLVLLFPLWATGIAQAKDAPLSWSSKVSLAAGYNDNISISSAVRPGQKQGSATTALAGYFGPTLALGEVWEVSLSYSLDQSIYYNNSDYNTQTHGLELAGEYQGERLEAAVGYVLSAAALVPLGVFYSLEHNLSGSLDLLAIEPLWFGLEYSFHYYDIKEEDYDYLGGTKHTADLYGELFLKKVLVYLGYRLQVARLGQLQDEMVTNSGIVIQTTTPLSYQGHLAFLRGRWRPIETISLKFEAQVGKKLYDDAALTAGSGPGGGKAQSRSDTFFSFSLGPAWRFFRGLSLEASFSYETTSSSIKTRRLSSSYDNFVGTGGLSWKI